MTLEEAIKHCKDIALSCTNKECALEHFQLLKWLQEYSNILKNQDEQNLADKVKPKFKVKYAGSEYNVLEVKDIAGVVFYGIEDEPNHIDYIKAENCERVGGYSIKENGSTYLTTPAVFSEQKSVWGEEDERLCSCLIEEQEESLDNVENDKYGHSEIISDLKDMYRERINWLKSLKDRVQPQWKPSEGHIRYLQAVINDVHNIGSESCCIALGDLLEQLKKL